MKHVLVLLIASIITSLASAQEKANIDTLLPIDEKTGTIKYQEVIEVSGNPTELYERAELWIKKYFPNPSGVIGSRSKEQGYINGVVRLRIYDQDKKGNMVGTPRVVSCDMKLEFKDSRFRYSFSDFKLQATSNYPLERWLNSESPYFNEANFIYLRQVNNDMEKMIISLAEAMEPTEEEKDEW